MAIQMIEEDMLWTAIELRAIEQSGGTPAERQAVIEEAKRRGLRVSGTSGGGIEIQVEDGHALNKPHHCHHEEEPVSKMRVKPAKEPRKDPKPEF